MSDTYKTILEPTEGTYKDKGSRFIARVYPVESVEEVKEILVLLRKEYHDARHHCYAYRLGPGDSSYRVNDDGEPANSAGKPILGQIQSYHLTNILIVVIRYFGGILLGVGGLINAYRTAAKEGLDHAVIIEKTFNCVITIGFQYPAMNDVMRVIKDSKSEIISQESGITCKILVRIRKGAAIGLINRLQRIDLVDAQIDTL
ncbi:MAG: YigZ family protein [Bacteroidia bacterium]|nr:YigZ family protein [Bacteroidia bacterium]